MQKIKNIEHKDCSASSTWNKRGNTRLPDKCCHGHSCRTPQEMESDIGLASCDGDSSCPSDQVIEQRGHKNFVKPGGDNLKLFGSSRPYEILSKIKRRPSSECKMRELSSNDVFRGQFPMKQDCGGAGSDITGRCPARPSSCSKTSELQGHNIFGAFLNPSQPSPPPPMPPYLPEEIRLPPDKIRRNPQKLASHFTLGGPEYLDPPGPKSESSWARQRMLYGSVIDEMQGDGLPVSLVSDLKARELAGHTNLFGIPPRFSPAFSPPPERRIIPHCVAGNDPDDGRQNHRKKIQDLVGYKADLISDDRSNTHRPCRHPVSDAKAHELRGNDIFARPKLSDRGGCSSSDTKYALTTDKACKDTQPHENNYK